MGESRAATAISIEHLEQKSPKSQRNGKHALATIETAGGLENAQPSRQFMADEHIKFGEAAGIELPGLAGKFGDLRKRFALKPETVESWEKFRYCSHPQY